jgi:hypothetical protein
MVAVVVVVVPLVPALLVVALLVPLTMMAVVRLLDNAVVLADARHLAEDVTGDRSGLSASDGNKKSTRNGGEGEKFLHKSSFSTIAAAAFVLLR